MSTVTTRQPTIRFPRLHKFQLGQQCLIYWNGSRADDGTGVPGDPPAAVDYNTVLDGPFTIWPDLKNLRPHARSLACQR